MLSVSEIREFPDGLKLLAWSEEELSREPREAIICLMQTSPSVWHIDRDGETLLVAGVFMPMLIGGVPELWLLLCEGIRHKLARNLREIRELVKDLVHLYPHVIVQVDAKFPVGRRFAEFMGFSKQVSYSVHAEREYIVFEVNDGNSAGT